MWPIANEIDPKWNPSSFVDNKKSPIPPNANPNAHRRRYLLWKPDSPEYANRASIKTGVDFLKYWFNLELL